MLANGRWDLIRCLKGCMKNQQIHQSFIMFGSSYMFRHYIAMGLDGRVVSSDVVRSTHHVTRQNTPIHNILSTAPKLSIFQKALGTLPEDGNVIPKHVGATIHN